MSGFQSETGEHQAALRRKAESGAGADSASPVHPLLTLQSQIGNAQVARLLAQREADDDTVSAKHDFSVQREAEDDEVAAKHDTSVQRAEDDETVSAKHENVGIEGGPVGPDTAQRISSARGGGSSL